MFKFILQFCALICLVGSCGNQSDPIVQTGLDRAGKFAHLFSGKRIGIITNHTAYSASGEFISDVFQKIPDMRIVALFGPEHGIHGTQAAGQAISDSESTTGDIPVYSLYGKVRKPTPDMLRDIDVLVYDIQDIGARFYTYISTMCLAMEAAAETNIPFVVLDRPNPINGIAVEGNLLDTSFASFVGMYPIPVRHGMTSGEIAMMVHGEGWLPGKLNARPNVIPMQGWKRSMWYDQTGLVWRAPSPNMPDLRVATVYPGTCLFEGTNISEGRGTYQPFLRIGAPWIMSRQIEAINSITGIAGVHLGPIEFTPRPILSMAPHPKYSEQQITGIFIKVTDRDQLQPYRLGVSLVKYFYDLDSLSFRWKSDHFDRLCGTDQIRLMITGNQPVSEINRWIDRDLQQFMEIRSRYLLY